MVVSTLLPTTLLNLLPNYISDKKLGLAAAALAKSLDESAASAVVVEHNSPGRHRAGLVGGQIFNA
jgi:hypothetical protein